VDDRFRSIFEELSREYVEKRQEPERPFGVTFGAAPETAALSKDAVDEAVARLGLGERLRPAARHFLLVNFNERVVAPLAADRQTEATPRELRDDVRKDAERVLARASERRAERRRRDPRAGPDISGGDVLGAVDEMYDDLLVSRFRVWN
jgi:hypothetical protein